MTDIQRWAADNGELVKFEDANGILTWRTVVVTYADAVRWRDEAVNLAYGEGVKDGEAGKDKAVAAAEQRGYENGQVIHRYRLENYTDGIKAARDAVISLRSGSWGTDYDGVQIDMADALAAIDEVKA